MNWLYKTVGYETSKDNIYVIYWKNLGDYSEVLIQLESKPHPAGWNRFSKFEINPGDYVRVGNYFGKKKSKPISFHELGKPIPVNFSEIKWAFLVPKKN